MADGASTNPVVTAPASKATGYGIVAAAQAAGKALLSVPEVMVDVAVAVIDMIALQNAAAASPAKQWVTAARAMWKELQAENPALPDVVIADLRWYSTYGFRVTGKPAVRDLWAAGYDAWTNSSSLVLVSEKFGKMHAADPQVAKILLRHEAKHVEQFLSTGRPSTYFDMVKFEADAYARTHEELQSAGHAGIEEVVDFFEGRAQLASEPDDTHRRAMIDHKDRYLPATAGVSPSSLYIP